MTAAIDFGAHTIRTILGYHMDEAPLATYLEPPEPPRGTHYYVVLMEQHEVLGVWEAMGEVDLARVRLHLGLSFPDCQTIVHTAANFEELRLQMENINLQELTVEHDVVS